MTTATPETTKQRIVALVEELYEQVKDLDQGRMTPARREFQLQVTRLLKGIISAYEEWLKSS